MEPRIDHVQCISPMGLHRMAYAEWGDRANPRVVVCVHGLTRTGRDFDELARALATEYRVICPDIVGRGRSSWLPTGSGYAVPQYVADCVTLLARVDAPAVGWVGTSMGGLIGMGLAALPGNPIRRMVLNDVGPALGAAGLQRIGAYAGKSVDFASFDEGVQYIERISTTFGPLTHAQWTELCRHMIVPRGERWGLHYDPKIGEATRALVESGAQTTVWPMWDAIDMPVLLLRGADSDLLEDATATEMTQRGPKARRIDYAGIGHAPSLVTPDQINDVKRFLDEGWSTMR